MQGVTYRQHKKAVKDVVEDAPPQAGPSKACPSYGEVLTMQRKWQVPPWARPVVDYFLHLILHHWVSVMSLLSIHITDVRAIMEELDGLEIRSGDWRLAFGQDISVPPEYRPPLQPDEYGARRASTPGHAPETPRTRRHAPSPSISQMSKAVWSHAIGNAIGRMAFSLRVSDVTALLPLASRVAAEQPSASACEGPHATLASFNSVLRNRKRRSKIDPALRPPPAGYQRIASLTTTSNIMVSLGIGPATQVFDKDNLRADVRFGNLELSLEGLEKVVAINKARRKLKDPASLKPSRVWAEGSLARVSLCAPDVLTCSASFVHSNTLRYPVRRHRRTTIFPFNNPTFLPLLPRRPRRAKRARPATPCRWTSLHCPCVSGPPTRAWTRVSARSLAPARRRAPVSTASRHHCRGRPLSSTASLLVRRPTISRSWLRFGKPTSTSSPPGHPKGSSVARPCSEMTPSSPS